MGWYQFSNCMKECFHGRYYVTAQFGIYAREILFINANFSRELVAISMVKWKSRDIHDWHIVSKTAARWRNRVLYEYINKLSDMGSIQFRNCHLLLKKIKLELKFPQINLPLLWC